MKKLKLKKKIQGTKKTIKDKLNERKKTRKKKHNKGKILNFIRGYHRDRLLRSDQRFLFHQRNADLTDAGVRPGGGIHYQR